MLPKAWRQPSMPRALISMPATVNAVEARSPTVVKVTSVESLATVRAAAPPCSAKPSVWRLTEARLAKGFVDGQIAQLSGAEYLTYESAGWWEHQDLDVIRKPSAAAHAGIQMKTAGE